MKFFYYLIAALIFALPLPAQAQCSNPPAAMGVIIMNKAHKIMQYCNGDDWIGLRGGGGASGLPACSDGEIAQFTAGQWQCNGGSGIDNLNASHLTSGTVPPARLGTGTAASTTYLRGDGQWAVPSGGLTSCVSRYQSCNIGPSPQACDVACSSGEIATGGGCHSNATWQLYHYPNSSGGWRCAQGASGTLTVYLRCCK